MAFAARTRSRARRDQLPPHLDSLIELGVPTHIDPKAFTSVYSKIHKAVDGLKEPPLTKAYFEKPKCEPFEKLAGSVTRGELISPTRLRTMEDYKQLLGAEFYRTHRVGDVLDTSGSDFSYPMPGGLHLLRSGVKRKVSRIDIEDDNPTSLMLCGDTTHLGEVRSAIVIADGDIFLPGFALSDSLFVATGELHIRCPLRLTQITNCSFVAGDRILCDKPLDCSTLTFTAGGKIAVTAKDEKKPGVRHEKSKQAGLGLRFFKSEDVGVTFDPDLVRPVVKSVAADSPLRDVLKQGDELTQINGRRLSNTGDARRALREAAALEFAFVARSRDNAAPTMALARWPAR